MGRSASDGRAKSGSGNLREFSQLIELYVLPGINPEPEEGVATYMSTVTLRRAAQRAIPLACFILAGCVTPAGGGEQASAPASALQLYDGGNIITGGEYEARPVFEEGCLYLQSRNRRYVAFFPEGSVLNPSGTAIALPDGDTLELGQTYTLVLEFYPRLTNTNPACEGPNAYVRFIAETGE